MLVSIVPRGEMRMVAFLLLRICDDERFDKGRQERRFSVKPGLACLWQVNDRRKIGFKR